MEHEVEVFRVIRVPPMGALTVYAEGARHTDLKSIKSDTTRQRLLAAIGELVSFAGGYDALVKAGVAPSIARAEARPVGVSSEEEDEELKKRQEAFLNQLERSGQGRPAAESYTDSVITGESDRPALAGESARGSVNIVDEIDLILQRRLAANEQLAHRSIKLRQAQGERLQIVVDGKVYQHPNEIADEEVKQVLKQALQEWEAR